MNKDFNTKSKWLHARVEAHARLTDLGLSDGTYSLLKKLLGKPDLGPLGPQFTKEDYETCLLLAGPYTYTIYRMLCLKHGLNPVAEITPV